MQGVAKQLCQKPISNLSVPMSNQYLSLVTKCTIKDQLSLTKYCPKTIFNANKMICAQNYGAQNMYALKSWARGQKENMSKYE